MAGERDDVEPLFCKSDALRVEVRRASRCCIGEESGSEDLEVVLDEVAVKTATILSPR